MYHDMTCFWMKIVFAGGDDLGELGAFANGKKRKGFYAFEWTVFGPGVVDGLLHENLITRFVCVDPFRIHSKVKGSSFGK